MALLHQLRHLAVFYLLSTCVASRARNTVGDDDALPLPLVIWHGLGEHFAASKLHDVGVLAEAYHRNTFVYYARIAEDANSDRSATFLGNVTEQVAKVCADLASHPILSTAPAIDALGFSQGGQFLRAYVERCNKPPVRSLVTFGSQHNGIVEFRGCAATDYLCKGAFALLRWNAWSDFVQSRLVPAQYYRLPSQMDQYLAHSNFLADINNERIEKNTAYKKNMASLEHFVMYMFEDDAIVIPKQSSWFGEVNGTEITPLRARRLYSEDWLGLRELDRKGRLVFRTTPGDHMQLSAKVLNETFEDFFGPLDKKNKKSKALPGQGEL